MSEQKIDLLLKATLFNNAIYPVDQMDDAKVFANPWNAPVVKAVQPFDDGDIPDVVSRLFAKAEQDVLAKRDVATEGRHDATGYFSPVERDLRTIDEAWEELVGSHATQKLAHSDGVELEQSGRQLWKWHWKDGKVVRSEVTDPELPGGHLILDENCDEIAA